MELFRRIAPFKAYIIIPFAISLFAACETTSPEEPAAEEPPPQAPDSFAPPATIDEAVKVTSVKVLKLESYPVQAFAYITGTLPTSDSVLNPPRQKRVAQTIEIDLIATRPNPSKGESTPTPFEQKVPLELEGLRAGNYYVVVNNAESTLTLSRDNNAPSTTAPSTPVKPAAPIPQSPVESLPFTGRPH